MPLTRCREKDPEVEFRLVELDAETVRSPIETLPPVDEKLRHSMSRNLAASIRARLKQRADITKQDFNLTLTHYGLERLLYRLSASPHAADYLLKVHCCFRCGTTSRSGRRAMQTCWDLVRTTSTRP